MEAPVQRLILVAPLVGAWIEMPLWRVCPDTVSVAPLVGAWIEIHRANGTGAFQKSLPSWERGLKSEESAAEETVTGRSPRGSVD